MIYVSNNCYQYSVKGEFLTSSASGIWAIVENDIYPSQYKYAWLEDGTKIVNDKEIIVEQVITESEGKSETD